MTQELADLKACILEGRYKEALAIADELEAMSKQAILRNIQSFLLRLLIHLIKNQVEQRLTNSWAASISDSIRQIQKLNFKENKTSYYVSNDEWKIMLEEEFEAAIDAASAEVFEGACSPFQLSDIVDKSPIMQQADRLLALTYEYPARELPTVIKENLAQLAGGEDWKQGKRK